MCNLANPRTVTCRTLHRLQYALRHSSYGKGGVRTPWTPPPPPPPLNPPLNLIIANVKPGTEIHTDEWRSYARLTRRGYVHHTVNHSIEFVNPANGAHTQSIECTWAHAKKYKKMHGTSKALFPTYLVEFIWRRKIAKDTPFAMLMNCITVVYPL